MAQRKYEEGILTVTEREEHGRITLNSYNQLEPWQPVMFEYMGTCGKETWCVSHPWYLYRGSDCLKGTIL